MTCVPKHVFCGWYDPAAGSPSDFTAGNDPCVLIEATETRARATGSSIRFRSVGFGGHTNNITVQLNKYNDITNFNGPIGVQNEDYFMLGGGSPLPCGLLGYGSPMISVGSPLTYIGSPQVVEEFIINKFLIELIVKFTNTDTGSIEIKRYYACQEINEVGSPVTCGASIVSQLRDVLETDSTRRVDIPLLGDRGWVPSAECTIEPFIEIELTGGLPLPPLTEQYRTGPALTMAYITKSEDLTSGVDIPSSFISYWNGYCWKKKSLLVPDCVGDAGSPLLCELGPSSDC